MLAKLEEDKTHEYVSQNVPISNTSDKSQINTRRVVRRQSLVT